LVAAQSLRRSAGKGLGSCPGTRWLNATALHFGSFSQGAIQPRCTLHFDVSDASARFSGTASSGTLALNSGVECLRFVNIGRLRSGRSPAAAALLWPMVRDSGFTIASLNAVHDVRGAGYIIVLHPGLDGVAGSDFIIATMGEEAGFLGCILVLCVGLAALCAFASGLSQPIPGAARSAQALLFCLHPRRSSTAGWRWACVRSSACHSRSWGAAERRWCLPTWCLAGGSNTHAPD
jgi:hypothetical protein